MKYTNQNKGKCLNVKVLHNSKGYVVAKWCQKSCHYALEKYYKPIRDKHNINTMENFSLITQKLGDDYIRYLKRIQSEDDKKEEWNEEFEELFNG